jgi:parallel beta-helix repeat protein
LTGNITSDADGIVVERDNIVIDGAGCTLQGTGSGKGIDLYGRANVTVRDTQIKNFSLGIYLGSSNYNSISGNNIANNRGYGGYGIYLRESSNNSITGNSITNNDNGIGLQYGSGNNSVSGNNIANNGVGIDHVDSSNNSISGNNIANNGVGIYLWYSLNNSIIANTFTRGGLHVWHSYQNAVEDNTVNGKPLVYLEGVSGFSVHYAGQVILVKCSNINVENLDLSSINVGVQLIKTNSSSISGNNIANNWVGIDLSYSSNNIISGNSITNNGYGIDLSFSSNNSISGNNITASNIAGIDLYYSSGNCIYHNNFVDNTWDQARAREGSANNIWDDGYPSGGNYWSDYTGVDEKGGPNQDQSGSDGIGDAPYVIDADNRDRYPLMKLWIPARLGDLNSDGVVDIRDIAIFGKAFGSYPGHSRWNPAADLDGNGVINILDGVIVAKNFGKKW